MTALSDGNRLGLFYGPRWPGPTSAAYVVVALCDSALATVPCLRGNRPRIHLTWVSDWLVEMAAKSQVYADAAECPCIFVRTQRDLSFEP